jgi:hypothetical protein
VAHTRILPKADSQETARLVGARVRARQTDASACMCALHAHLYQVRIGAHSENLGAQEIGRYFVFTHLWVLLGGGSGGRSPPLEPLPAAGG